MTVTSQHSAAFEVLAPYLRSSEPKVTLVAAKCIGLMAGYEARWRNSPYLIEDVECTLTSDLFNPATKARSRTFQMAGKLDVRAREISTGRRVIFDHKSTSEDITDPAAPYWRQLVIEAQPTHYMILEWLNNEAVDFAVWDVMHKPDISPKGLSKKEREMVFDSGQYCEQEVASEDLEEFAETSRETRMMYAARLAQDCTSLRPQRYFQRKTVPRLESEMTEYMADFWDIAQDLITARRTNRWPRTAKACMTYNSPCTYLSVCSGEDTLDSDKWVRRRWVHRNCPSLQTMAMEANC